MVEDGEPERLLGRRDGAHVIDGDDDLPPLLLVLVEGRDDGAGQVTHGKLVDRALVLRPINGFRRKLVEALGKLQGARLDNAGLQEPSCEGDKLTLGLVITQKGYREQTLLALLSPYGCVARIPNNENVCC